MLNPSDINRIFEILGPEALKKSVEKPHFSKILWGELRGKCSFLVGKVGWSGVAFANGFSEILDPEV